MGGVLPRVLPLGQGKVDIPAVMDVIEKAQQLTYAMVKLDRGKTPPMTLFETAQSRREYLKKLCYQFRA